MGQIVVSGGAGYWVGPDGMTLDQYVLALTGKDRPRVCVVNTASGDAAEYIQGFYDVLGPYCEPSHLSLFLPPFEDPEALLSRQDVIYVGGGSTVNMLAIWRLHGIDTLIRAAMNTGSILYGSSAGGICWFESGLTESIGFDGVLRPLTNGFGLLPGSHAPHFDLRGRSEAFSAMIADGSLHDGIGIDDFAAAHFMDGELQEVVSARDGASAHLVRREAQGRATVESLPARLLA